MKANAPEKLFITNDEKRFSDKCHSASTEKYIEDDIEYTRTDVFIEKAKKWFEEQNKWIDLEGNLRCDMESFADFVKYMKEEKV